ncbi:MAG: hypothetical protein COA44_15680 [Arcobacter sp.]|nr:MAG: hypothetical protein COA44_15680 [Arcobacter sp.]
MNKTSTGNLQSKNFSKTMFLSSLAILVLGACSHEEVKKSENKVMDMKCGAGKCGANMFDGNAALGKKKKNILSQMREDDSRKDCVIAAKTTRATYNCVRDPKGKKLIMKCGVGKCGSETDRSKEPMMKCGTGKCGASMEAKK